jgi:hypothetical protein
VLDTLSQWRLTDARPDAQHAQQPSDQNPECNDQPNPGKASGLAQIQKLYGDYTAARGQNDPLFK